MGTEGEGVRGYRRVIHDIRRYFETTIWSRPPNELAMMARLQRRVARAVYLVIRSCFDDALILRASALTYQTMLGMVPLLAMIFAIAKGLSLRASSMVEGILAGLAVKEVAEQIVAYVQQTDVAALGAVGLLFSLRIATKLLSQIETSFNHVWGVTEGRTFARKIGDYLGILLIYPVLVLISTGVTASLNSSALVSRLLESTWVSWFTRIGVGALPFVTVWLAFTFIYMYVPNTKVRFGAAFVGAVVAGSAWHLSQFALFWTQAGIARYNVVYGTFASIPVFLIWLNLSWVIVLLGSEIAFAVQHESTYHPPAPRTRQAIVHLEQAALHMLARIWGRFQSGEPALDAGDLAADLDLSRAAAIDVLDGLLEGGLLVRAGDGSAILPAYDLGRVSVGELLAAFRRSGDGAARVDGPDLLDGSDLGIMQSYSRIKVGLRGAAPELLGEVVAVPSASA